MATNRSLVKLSTIDKLLLRQKLKNAKFYLENQGYMYGCLKVSFSGH
jgi:hypothetical protein